MTWKNSQFMIYRGTIEELKTFINSKSTYNETRSISVYSRPDIKGIIHWSTNNERSDEIAELMGFTKATSFTTEPA